MVVAMEFFQDILEKKRPCNEVTYATIINWFCKIGEIGKALELLKKMDEDMTSVSCFSPIIWIIFVKDKWMRS